MQEDHVVEAVFAHGVGHDVTSRAHPAGADAKVKVGEDFRFLGEFVAGDRYAICGVACGGYLVFGAEMGSYLGSNAAVDAVCTDE